MGTYGVGAVALLPRELVICKHVPYKATALHHGPEHSTVSTDGGWVTVQSKKLPLSAPEDWSTQP